MKKSKLLSILLVTSMTLTSIVAGCSKKSPETPGTSSKESVNLKEVKLVGYLPGDPDKDQASIDSELNKLTKKDINATVEIKWISWSDWAQKYPLVLSSGEDFDFAYVANWANFSGLAQKHAFMDITNLLAKDTPEILKKSDKDAWKSARVQGKIYSIPSDGKLVPDTFGLIYREDLRIKYNVPEFNKLEDFEAYMEAVKKNEKNIKPVSLNAIDNNYLFGMNLFEKLGYTSEGVSGVKNIGYKLEDSSSKLLTTTEMPEYKDTVNLMVKWQKAGYWSTADMIGKTKSSDLFKQGKVAMFYGNGGNLEITTDSVKKDHPDWKLSLYVSKDSKGNVTKHDALSNGVAVGANSKNPDRTLMLMDKVLINKDYAMLMCYGIKDKHYVLDDKGHAQYLNGISAEKADAKFWNNPFSWFIYDKATSINQEITDASKIQIGLDKIKKAPGLLGMNIDTLNIKAEIANMDDVSMQYELPVQFGIIRKSVDEDLAELNDNYKKAGLVKVTKEVQTQVDQFKKENNIK